jgi:hypothetical protein
MNGPAFEPPATLFFLLKQSENEPSAAILKPVYCRQSKTAALQQQRQKEKHGN